jgi:hypothetical protein
MHTISKKSSAQKTSACMGPATYLAGLKAQLDITQDQCEAWAAYVAVVLSNRQRMEDALDEDAPFGALADRLAALVAIRRAGSRVYACLNAAQRISAGVLLPLCCQGARLAAAA